MLGRNAHLVSENENEPVHIVMERVTSKTVDIFVEYKTYDEAVQAIDRLMNQRLLGRPPRLGMRVVEADISSQEEFLHALFPKAKNVDWKDGRARIIPTNPGDDYNSGFRGFLIEEELTLWVKHVEYPTRVSHWRFNRSELTLCSLLLPRNVLSAHTSV